MTIRLLRESTAEKTLFVAPTTKLREADKVIGSDGTVELCIITPGWGSSGYYSESVLKEASALLVQGTQNFWDHPTISEEIQRPERSLRDLAGVLVESASWQDQGWNGPGVYAKGKVFGDYRESLEEMASNIGVSLVAYGISHHGEAEGESGEIIDSIVAVRSADYVTLPGRGGAIKTMFEAARGKNKTLAEAQNVRFHFAEADLSHDAIRDLLWDALRDKFNPGQEYGGPWPREVYDDYVVYSWDGKMYKASYVIDTTGDETACKLGDSTEVIAVWEPVKESDTGREEQHRMDELERLRQELATRTQERDTAIQERDAATQEVASLKESNSRLSEALVVNKAADHISERLGKVTGLPANTATRITESLKLNPPTKEDGTLDIDKLNESILGAVKKEAQYLKDLGVGLGEVRGLGESSEGEFTSLFGGPAPEGDGTDELESAFKDIGLTESAAKLAAGGRV